MTAPSTEGRTVHDVYAEGSRYFMGEGELHGALGELCSDLERSGIDDMVIGAIALLAYGYPRFTEDINLVMTAEGLEKSHRELVGPGYAPAFRNARKKFRATRASVPVESIVAGEYPGDSRPKPVSFPAPDSASVEIDGVRFVTLEKLVELKLASGMTAPDRLKDLADVQELIKLRGLGEDSAQRLDPYVREKFFELLRGVEESRRRGGDGGRPREG